MNYDKIQILIFKLNNYLSYILFKMDGNKQEKINTLRVQIEYYFSDKNLEHDKFFNEKIREDLNVIIL